MAKKNKKKSQAKKKKIQRQKIKFKVKARAKKINYKKNYRKLKLKKSSREKAEARRAREKARAEHVIVKPTEEEIKNLIVKGRSRGFLTETELLHVFPEIEEYIFDYELTLEALQKNGIQIIEDTGGFLGAGDDIKNKSGQIIGFSEKKKFDIFKTFEIFNSTAVSIIKERIIQFVHIEAENFFMTQSSVTASITKDNAVQLSVLNNEKVYNLLTCTWRKYQQRVLNESINC